ncbi:transposable element Tcb1 transposase [Trichonephila clavipes]|uniref:Transposable element Tcb1 transposase n=1 Tax=Trichonephila clavipes TaxID=2585209 RepID=A0A8X6REU3_TRICX|nr:transposable element Tcb1 transposase [Trichonephila clavipes]
MLPSRFRAHYEQLSEFERGCIIELKEGATNPASNCILTIIEDVSADGQGSFPRLLSLLHVTQTFNKELLSRVPFLLKLDLFGRHKRHTYSTSLIKHFLVQPDPSPIEHVWDMMGRRLHQSENVDNLARQSEQIWQEIPHETISVLYHSMSACIQASGGSSPY